MKTACFFRVDLKEYLFIWRNKIEKKNFTKKTTLNAATLILNSYRLNFRGFGLKYSTTKLDFTELWNTTLKYKRIESQMEKQSN